MDAQTSAVMVRLDRVAQRIGLAIVESQNGQARRFAAWGREIEYVVLETGAVRASALMDEEIMATSTKSVEWLRQLMLKAKADQLPAAGAAANVPFRFGFRTPEDSPPPAQLRPPAVRHSRTGAN